MRIFKKEMKTWKKEMEETKEQVKMMEKKEWIAHTEYQGQERDGDPDGFGILFYVGG